MHILYLHQHFALPQGSTGTRSYELARRWVKAGHRVTLICGVTDQCGFSVGKRKNVFDVDGIQVVALNTPYTGSLSSLARILVFIRFMVLCFWTGLNVKGVDVIYATSTPLTIGIPAMLLKWFKRVPFVFEIRDQWPEIPIEMGYIKNAVAKKMLLWLEKRIYKSSAAVVGLSPGMSQGVRDVLNGTAKEIITAPNSSDTSLFHPSVQASKFREQMNWETKFIVLHFGAMGKANGLDFLINAAVQLQDKKDIYFALVGKGSERKRLQNKIENLKLTNIQVLDTFSKQQMPEVVAAADVSTVIFADFPILQDNSANKFFDSLSAGKPILLNYSGWQRDKIEEYKCGYGCRQGNLEEYVQKLTWFYENRHQLAEMGQNARKLAEQEFDRDLISSRILSLIEKVHASQAAGK